MSYPEDRHDERKRELECLRLTSDLLQLAKETLDPDFRAHCLRMAKHWSDEADESAEDSTGADRDLGQ